MLQLMTKSLKMQDLGVALRDLGASLRVDHIYIPLHTELEALPFGLEIGSLSKARPESDEASSLLAARSTKSLPANYYVLKKKNRTCVGGILGMFLPYGASFVKQVTNEIIFQKN
ncbi:Uncharacterized protein TCM_031340 [Theobroma cacao]|uniref:Uncharacterized protein n=1 Tax=Theobroma cacao TaxID=3641 RepID=A0A061F7Z9_THECC|nr:Uncharacterized protein TCM_031340 [Theobroma cacao]